MADDFTVSPKKISAKKRKISLNMRECSGGTMLMSGTPDYSVQIHVMTCTYIYADNIQMNDMKMTIFKGDIPGWDI